MQMRHTNALGLMAVTLLVAAGASCSGGGNSGGGMTYDKCMAINDPLRQANCLIDLSVKQEGLQDRAGAGKSRETAGEVAIKIHGMSDQIDALLRLADAHVAAGDSSRAKKSYESAEEVLDQISSADAKSRFLVRLAKLKLDADKRDGAEFAASDLKAAEALLDDITLAEAKIEVLALLTESYGRLDNTDATKRIAVVLVELPESIDDWSSKAKALVAVAGAQRTALEDAAAAEATLDEARKIVEAIDHEADKSQRLKKGYRLMEIAAGYVAAGKREAAIQLLDVANLIAQQDPDGSNLSDKVNEVRARL